MPVVLGSVDLITTVSAYMLRHFKYVRVWGWVGTHWAIGVIRVEPNE